MRLSYIDKIHAAYERAEQGVLRLLRLQVALSVVLIALVTGLVSTAESIDITGIKLELPLWLVLGGGGVAVGLLTVTMTLMWDSADTLSTQLVALYWAEGYDVPSRLASEGIGFESGLIAAVNRAERIPGEQSPRRRRFGALIAFCSLCVTILLPMAAQLVVAIKLGGDFGWTWRVWLPLGVALTLSLSSVVWLIAGDLERANRLAELR